MVPACHAVAAGPDEGLAPADAPRVRWAARDLSGRQGGAAAEPGRRDGAAKAGLDWADQGGEVGRGERPDHDLVGRELGGLLRPMLPTRPGVVCERVRKAPTEGDPSSDANPSSNGGRCQESAAQWRRVCECVCFKATVYHSLAWAAAAVAGALSSWPSRSRMVDSAPSIIRSTTCSQHRRTTRVISQQPASRQTAAGES